MDISFVLAVYNNINLTKEFYKNLRILYPSANLIISDGGSSDGTAEWLESLKDINLIHTSSKKQISFSENYNNAIKLVRTEKLVLVHNDMIIGEQFLENLDKLLNENIILSYTTIEPPIFSVHERPGKIILDCGPSFNEFNYKKFEQIVLNMKDKCDFQNGATFFMSGYKKVFIDIGLFDELNFFPCFCEDDDFLIRARLKGYELATTNCAITYHFVSQTSRFSDEFKNNRDSIEINSNRNFIRKWGTSVAAFNTLEYQSNLFDISKNKLLLKINTNDINMLEIIEPFFDCIDCHPFPTDYVKKEQLNTAFDLDKKFTNYENVNVIVECLDSLTNKDMYNIFFLKYIIKDYNQGKYKLGNFLIIFN